MASATFQEWYEKFASTGDICPIRLGMSRDEIRATFGEPDDVGATSRKRPEAAIWVYGGLEFHFLRIAPKAVRQVLELCKPPVQSV